MFFDILYYGVLITFFDILCYEFLWHTIQWRFYHFCDILYYSFFYDVLTFYNFYTFLEVIILLYYLWLGDRMVAPLSEGWWINPRLTYYTNAYYCFFEMLYCGFLITFLDILYYVCFISFLDILCYNVFWYTILWCFYSFFDLFYYSVFFTFSKYYTMAFS